MTLSKSQKGQEYVSLPEFKPEYERVITEEDYNKCKAEAEAILERLARIYEIYCETDNEALADSFKVLCDDLYRVTRVMVLADSNGFHILADKLLERGCLLIYLAGAVAGD